MRRNTPFAEDPIMWEEMVAIVMFVAGAFMVVKVADTISDGRTRRRLIQSNASPELAAAVIATAHGDQGLNDALKWGIVLGAIGVGLVIVQFLPYETNEPIVFGVILIFAALGLLAYVASVRRLGVLHR